MKILAKIGCRHVTVICFFVAVSLLGARPVWAQQGGVGVNFETRLSALEDQFRALNGHLEQLDFAIRRLDQTQQHAQADIESRLTKLEQAPPVQAVQAPPVAVVAPVPVNGTIGDLKERGGSVTGAVNNPKTPPLPETPADYGLTPQEQYDRAFGLLRQASYDEAEKAFKGFIEKNPKDKLIDNAKYWYGETLYVRGRFEDSAVAFADAWQQNPQGTKAPDSLLKLGMSLSALNKTADACTSLAEVKTKYPNAPASVRSRAEEERAKLKCAAH